MLRLFLEVATSKERTLFARSTFRSQNAKNTPRLDHFWTFNRAILNYNHNHTHNNNNYSDNYNYHYTKIEHFNTTTTVTTTTLQLRLRYTTPHYIQQLWVR